MSYLGMQCELVSFTGHNGDKGEAYYARPTGAGRCGAIVLIHHLPGWDEFCVEATRKLAHHGFLAIDPNLYFRSGPGSPDDQSARARAQGGVFDDQVMADVRSCMDFLRALPQSNGKVGVMGFCSGGRYAWLAGCLLPNVDAVVDCWGAKVIIDEASQLTPQRPVAPIDYTERMTAPLLGLFGNDDDGPSPDQVNRTEKVLKRLRKDYKFYRYDGAGHSFFTWSRPAYRAEQAMDGWSKALAFLHQHLD